MIKNIIAEITAYGQVANSKDPAIPESQRDHALLMVVGLCDHLKRVHGISIIDIIAMIEALDITTDTQ